MHLDGVTHSAYPEWPNQAPINPLLPADWLNRVLSKCDDSTSGPSLPHKPTNPGTPVADAADINVDNFMSRLDNGVTVCRLARLVEQQCGLTAQGYSPRPAQVSSQIGSKPRRGSATRPSGQRGIPLRPALTEWLMEAVMWRRECGTRMTDQACTASWLCGKCRENPTRHVTSWRGDAL